MERTFPIDELLSEAGWLRRLASSLVGDAALAEDLVQETWIAALRRPPAASSAPRPWLARVVRNLARNARRGRARSAAREDFAHEERAQPGPETLAQEAEAQRLLAEAVTRLAEPLRAVIVLCYFQALDSSAAARRLDVPASTVRTRLQKALEELRADLDRRCDGGRRSWSALLVPLVRRSADASAGAASVAAGATPLVSLPVLAAAAGAASVLLVLGAATWSVARDERALAGAPLDAGVAAGAETVTQASVSPAPAPSEGARSGGEREPLDLRSAGDARSVPVASPAAPGDGLLSGTILVDGRPPEWPIQLRLEPALPPLLEQPTALGARVDALRKRVSPVEQTITPEQRGAFSFGALSPDWSGRLVVDGYAFADGSSALDVPAPESGLVLQLASGPEIVGRMLGPDGLPAADLEGSYQFAIGRDGEPAHEIDTGRFPCRTDGRFRIPSKARGEWGALTLVVEARERGYLVHETPHFVSAQGLDLGDLELEPLRPLAFTVRDPSGAPIAGAFARVDGPAWFGQALLTGADGSGVLEVMPARGAGVRFGALAHADRVLHVAPGDAPEVVLEPLAVLEVQLLGSVAASTERVLLSAERAAFRWDEDGWEESVAFQCGLGASRPCVRRTPIADGQRYEYEFCLSPDGRLELVGLAPDLTLALEALDGARRPLAAGTVSVAAGQRATLELGTGDPVPPLVLKQRAPAGPR